jgi:hypothetical protein
MVCEILYYEKRKKQRTIYMKIDKFTNKKRRPNVYKAAASQASRIATLHCHADALHQVHVSAMLSSGILQTAS